MNWFVEFYWNHVDKSRFVQFLLGCFLGNIIGFVWKCWDAFHP